MAHRDQHNFDLSAHFLICLPLNNAVSLKVGLDLPPQVAVRYPATAKNMTQVLHISDIHFEEESADQDSVLAALKHSIQKLTFDVVVVSGDIARTATAAQFERAKAYIETVAAGRPALVVPGNHDVDRSRIDSKPS